MPPDGELITCDIDPKSTEIAQWYWREAGLEQRIHLKLAPALQTIGTLRAPLDLAFIDADKANYVNYWNAIIPLIRVGGVVVADNVLWSGRILDPRDADTRALVEFSEHVKRDTRVDNVMLTVRDGLMVAIKN